MHNWMIFPHVTDNRGWRPGRQPNYPIRERGCQNAVNRDVRGTAGPAAQKFIHTPLAERRPGSGHTSAGREDSTDSTVGRSGDPAKEAHPRCTVTSARRKKPTPTYLLTSKYILKTNRAFY